MDRLIRSQLVSRAKLMASDSITLGAEQLSAVQEMAKVGLTHATTALSGMTGRQFQMSVPGISSLAISNIPELLGGEEMVALGVYMPFEGDAEGHIAFLFPWKSGVYLWNLLLGASPEDWTGVGELECSVLLEIGNIVNSNFLNAISDRTNLRLMSTPPAVSIEMAGAIMASITAEAEMMDAVALTIATRIFVSDDESVDGFFVCIPSLQGLNTIFGRFGIPEAA